MCFQKSAMPHTARFHSGIIWGLLFEWCALFHPAVAPGLQEVEDRWYINIYKLVLEIKGLFSHQSKSNKIILNTFNFEQVSIHVSKGELLVAPAAIWNHMG